MSRLVQAQLKTSANLLESIMGEEGREGRRKKVCMEGCSLRLSSSQLTQLLQIPTTGYSVVSVSTIVSVSDKKGAIVKQVRNL